jgi:SAM-dependent methyltransferase
MNFFECNVCGEKVPSYGITFHREIPSCSFCLSTVRIREIAWHLKIFVDGEQQCRVLGLSDHQVIQSYALGLKLNYTNTFFDKNPLLDISHPSQNWCDSTDILISSDVIEHVMPPLANAFSGHYKVLKPGGKLILTAPYFKRSSFLEKYPFMISYTVDENLNVIALDKDYNSFKIVDPIFHGGPGKTLEMRLLTPETIREGLELAGFQDVFFHENDILDYGIVRSTTNVGTITAVKPLSKHINYLKKI